MGVVVAGAAVCVGRGVSVPGATVPVSVVVTETVLPAINVAVTVSRLDSVLLRLAVGTEVGKITTDAGRVGCMPGDVALAGAAGAIPEATFTPNAAKIHNAALSHEPVARPATVCRSSLNVARRRSRMALSAVMAKYANAIRHTAYKTRL